MHFQNTLWVLRFKMFLFFYALVTVQYFLQWPGITVFMITDFKIQTNKNSVMSTAWMYSPSKIFYYFYNRKTKKKERKKENRHHIKGQVLREWWYLHQASFEGRKQGWSETERKWSNVGEAAWVGPFQRAEKCGALCFWRPVTIIWNAQS